jgi:hypothetical protein
MSLQQGSKEKRITEKKKEKCRENNDSGVN